MLLTLFCMLLEYKAIAKTTHCSKIIRFFRGSMSNYFRNE